MERRVDDSWVRVAARRHDDLASRATWLDLAVPAQDPGQYRLLTIRPGSDGPLPHPEGEGRGGMTLAAFRVLDPAGGRQVVLGTSDQPAGRYRVVTTDDRAPAGVAVTRLERARYTVEAAELEVRTTAPAGERVRLAAPPER